MQLAASARAADGLAVGRWAAAGAGARRGGAWRPAAAAGALQRRPRGPSCALPYAAKSLAAARPAPSGDAPSARRAARRFEPSVARSPVAASVGRPPVVRWRRRRRLAAPPLPKTCVRAPPSRVSSKPIWSPKAPAPSAAAGSFGAGGPHVDRLDVQQPAADRQREQVAVHDVGVAAAEQGRRSRRPSGWTLKLVLHLAGPGDRRVASGSCQDPDLAVVLCRARRSTAMNAVRFVRVRSA